MGFRDREKLRLVPLKSQLFSVDACGGGLYMGKTRDFCLRADRSAENLHDAVRDEAVDYFETRGIPWHDGQSHHKPRDRPSNHLCCSQSACVNFWFPFVREPQLLAEVFRSLGYDVEEMLPFDLDMPLRDSVVPYVAFEWVGARNYLKELLRGKVAPDQPRTRGAGFTSLDFAARFRQRDGRVRIVAGEWKYTEYYRDDENLRFSGSHTDRLGIYGPLLASPTGPLRLGSLSPEVLFFDPFDQLMRQQLLASEMERESEMSADIVSLLHVAPRANAELMERITSPGLSAVGGDIHSLWKNLAPTDRFHGIYVEDLLPIVTRHAPDQKWADYMQLRYGGMK